jgi:nitrile hydratase accessory protein
MFGITMALYDAGRFEWSEFQQRLISAIDQWEREHPTGEGYRYYERWAEALEALLDQRDIVATTRIDERTAALAARPSGHDHLG